MFTVNLLRQEDRESILSSPQVIWKAFPDVVLLAAESDTKRHLEYPAAKAGDAEAAARLVRALVDKAGIAAVRTLIGLISEGGPAHIDQRSCLRARRRQCHSDRVGDVPRR